MSNHSNITLNAAHFTGNSANFIGGAIFANQSQLWVNQSDFTGNSAVEYAGGIYGEQSNCTMITCNFTNHRADRWGAAIFYKLANANCTDCTLTGNAIATAILATKSNVTFAGSTEMTKNSQRALIANLSSVTFTGHTLFKDNYVDGGGGAVRVASRTKLKFSGVTIFSNNSATEAGGAILAAAHSELEMTGNVTFRKCTAVVGGAIFLIISSRITIADRVIFESNKAVNGGAMFIKKSTMNLKKHATVATIQNHAKHYGGAIFYEDYMDPVQCSYSPFPSLSFYFAYNLPDCYLQLENFKFNEKNGPQYEILSYNDSAGFAGQFMYGGLLDRCIVMDPEGQTTHGTIYHELLRHHIIKINSAKINEADACHVISSPAYTICTCGQEVTCINPQVNISALRGQKFAVTVVALSQGGCARGAYLLAKVKQTARLELNQYSKTHSTRLH